MLAVATLATSACWPVYDDCWITDLEVDEPQISFDGSGAPQGIVRCSAHAAACVGQNGTVWSPSSDYFPEGGSGPDTTATLRSIAEVGGGLVAVGDAGTVFEWDQSNWRTHPIGAEGDLFDIVDNGTHVVIIGEGELRVSQDGGNSYDRVDVPGMMLHHLGCLTDGTFLAIGADGAMLHGDGTSWSEVDGPSEVDYTAILVTPGELLLGDAEGNVWANYHGEAEWRRETPPGSGPVLSLSGANLLWAGRADGTVSYSHTASVWESVERPMDAVSYPTGLWSQEYESYDASGWVIEQTTWIVGWGGDLTVAETPLRAVDDCSY
jgi:hypothetical protein